MGCAFLPVAFRVKAEAVLMAQFFGNQLKLLLQVFNLAAIETSRRYIREFFQKFSGLFIHLLTALTALLFVRKLLWRWFRQGRKLAAAIHARNRGGIKSVSTWKIWLEVWHFGCVKDRINQGIGFRRCIK